MKISVNVVSLSFLFTFILNLSPSTAHAQGTAFTYQGRLNSGGAPASGSYGIAFTLFATNISGVAIAGPVTNSAVAVTNGLFTTTVDFGNVFIAASNWLELAVSTNGANAFSTLAPRQQMTPVPYAITAANVSGTITSANVAGIYGNAVTLNNANNAFTGSFTGSGANVTNVNAATLGGMGTGYFWQTGGNAGTTVGANFIGTTDNQPLELHADGVRVLRLEPTGNVPNFIGGYSLNAILNGAVGATIGGGGASDGNPNIISSTLGTIAGGSGNIIGTNANDATISGGRQNEITDGNWDAVICGGHGNEISTPFQLPSASYSAVCGGYQNIVSDPYASVGGGYGNTIASYGSGSVIGGGISNKVSFTSFFGSFGGSDSTIGGGSLNAIYCDYGTIGGGYSNTVGNLVAGAAPTVSGGHGNTAESGGAVPGGEANSATGLDSFAVGDNAQATSDHSFVWGDGSAIATDNGANTFNVLASRGMALTVSSSSGLNPAAMYIHSTSGNGVGLYVAQISSDAALVVNNSGTGDILKGFDADFTGNPVFEVKNDGTVYSRAVLLTSDRNAKQNFTMLDAQTVLAKVTAMPITEWNYKSDAAEQKHIGPMAQDFHAAFGLNGTDDKHISVVDEGGVALAAIQGLNQKLAQKQTEITELQARLDKLEQLVQAKTGGVK